MYFYAAPLLCWLIQNVSASSELRQGSSVRTRPRLAPRIGPLYFNTGEGRRPPDHLVYDGAGDRGQPVNQRPNAGPAQGGPQQGTLFHMTQESQGIVVDNPLYWNNLPLGDWQQANSRPRTYDWNPYANAVVIPHSDQPNLPAKLQIPAPVLSRSLRPKVIRNNRGRKPIPNPDPSQLDTAKYERGLEKKRARDATYRAQRKVQLKAFVEEIAALKEEKAADKAEINGLKQYIALLESRALSLYVSDKPSEEDRLKVSEMNYQQSLPENTANGVEVPVGEPEGGFNILPQEDLELFFDQQLADDLWGSTIGIHRKLARSLQYNSDRGTERDASLRNRRRSTPGQNPPSDPVAEFRYYIDVYTQLRSNVSELLFPYFDNILNHTNSSSIYEMLRSVHSDLVAAGPWTIGPYSNGADCFDWIEEQLFGKITNTTLQNDTVVGVLVNHDMLSEIYSNIWGNASQIANQTGYLKQMSTVRQYLNPTNISLLPDTWKTAQPLPKLLDFDALYGKHNKTSSR